MHSVVNNYMIYKSTGHSEKQMHKKSIKKKLRKKKLRNLLLRYDQKIYKTAEEITAIFWPNRSN